MIVPPASAASSGVPQRRTRSSTGSTWPFAFGILLLMFVNAGSRFGMGRWWEAHTPAL